MNDRTATDTPHAEPAVGGAAERMVRPDAEARWYCVRRDGVATLCEDEKAALLLAVECDRDFPTNQPHRAVLLGDVAALREALTELRDRIKAHPAYADLTEDEEIDEGGDTAELSYLARVADAALVA